LSDRELEAAARERVQRERRRIAMDDIARNVEVLAEAGPQPCRADALAADDGISLEH
jgi:hypothetical protein